MQCDADVLYHFTAFFATFIIDFSRAFWYLTNVTLLKKRHKCHIQSNHNEILIFRKIISEMTPLHANANKMLTSVFELLLEIVVRVNIEYTKGRQKMSIYVRERR
jgi:hypothetical protein